MKKIRIGTLAKELGMTVAELHSLKEKKLQPDEYTGRAGVTWFDEAAADKLRLAVDIEPVVPDVLMATFVHEARNPRWVFAKIEGKEGKHPVLIPRRHRGKLEDKRFPVHAITDATGTTYRHADIAKFSA